MGLILSFQVLGIAGNYIDKNYSYNTTLTDSAGDHDELIIEGLFKLKGIKYKKNEKGQLQIRGKDIEKFKNILTMSETYKNYSFISKIKKQEITTELKEKKLKFTTIQNIKEDNLFLIWEEVPPIINN